MSKAQLPSVTLCVIDCTSKRHLAARAIEKSVEQCDFGAVKFLTDKPGFPNVVQIPPINSIEEYSRFVVRDLWRYVDTDYCLIAQADGYVLNGAAWTNDFLRYDYAGAPWPWGHGGTVGNGGFSLRSKKFMQFASRLAPNELPHPEDSWYCTAKRAELERVGFKFMPSNLARRFSFEGRQYDGQTWWGDSRMCPQTFGFHSWLSRLPDNVDRPIIYSHSGDIGDVIYSLAVVKEMGGGAYFLTGECLHPYPVKPKATADYLAFYHAAGSLVAAQPYIWSCQPTGRTPQCADVNFDEFRLAYKRGGAENWKSLLSLHADAFGVEVDGSKPWLEVDNPIVVPGRPIVVNRTPRYHNEAFPWWQLCRDYGNRMVFVGSEQEHQLFQGFAPDLKIPRQPTANMLEAARVIAGAKLFVGNQSSPLAVAHGLGKNVVVEEWGQNPNCNIARPGAIYYGRHSSGKIHLPEAWLQ